MIGDVGPDDGQGVGAEVGEDVGGESAGVFGMDLSQTGPAHGNYGSHETVAQAVAANVSDPAIAAEFGRENISYGPGKSFLGIQVYAESRLTDIDRALIEDLEYGFPISEADTSAEDATFPSMYDPAPPVVEPPVIDPITQTGPTISYEDSILFNFTPRERHSYLLNQINMGMEPTRGYTGPDGVYVDLTTVYPDIFNPDYVTFPDIDRPSIPDGNYRSPIDEITVDRPSIPEVFTQPMLPMSGGGYVDDYRMNRGGIMDLREPHRYNRGGNVMRNIRDEQARVIGVQDDAADEMNRIRYHSGRDARDERFRVAARERDAREEMGRLRGEARYEDMRGRGPRAFGHGGGVASLAPVARNMFRKRRLPRAGMVV